MGDVQFWGLDVGPWSDWAAAVASVGSVWAASYFARRSALDGAQLQIDAMMAAEYREQTELRRRVAAALLGEIEGIEKRVATLNIAAALRQLAAQYRQGGVPPGTSSTFFADSAYTAVYDALAERLGCFEADLAREIAAFYIEMKGIMETVSIFFRTGLQTMLAPIVADNAEWIARSIDEHVAKGQALKAKLQAIAE